MSAAENLKNTLAKYDTLVGTNATQYSPDDTNTILTQLDQLEKVRSNMKTDFQTLSQSSEQLKVQLQNTQDQLASEQNLRKKGDPNLNARLLQLESELGENINLLNTANQKYVEMNAQLGANKQALEACVANEKKILAALQKRDNAVDNKTAIQEGTQAPAATQSTKSSGGILSYFNPYSYFGEDGAADPAKVADVKMETPAVQPAADVDTLLAPKPEPVRTMPSESPVSRKQFIQGYFDSMNKLWKGRDKTQLNSLAERYGIPKTKSMSEDRYVRDVLSAYRRYTLAKVLTRKEVQDLSSSQIRHLFPEERGTLTVLKEEALDLWESSKRRQNGFDRFPEFVTELDTMPEKLLRHKLLASSSFSSVDLKDYTTEDLKDLLLDRKMSGLLD